VIAPFAITPKKTKVTAQNIKMNRVNFAIMKNLSLAVARHTPHDLFFPLRPTPS
jgi:hypothetical protein